MDAEGRLVDVSERTKIEREGDIAISIEDGERFEMPLDSIASMNCWGFTPDIFDGIMEGFKKFLATPSDNQLKREYYLPFAVTELMNAGKCDVKVYRSLDSWYGVTYADDKEKVKTSIAALIAEGKYNKELN